MFQNDPIHIARLFASGNGRVGYVEQFRWRPCINGDLASATEATREPANPHWEVLGTNGVSAGVTFSPGGGIVLTTTTASADQVIITPHLDTAQSLFAGVKWNTLDQVAFRAKIKTASAISDRTHWAGLKLTNTSVVATDNDQLFFRYAAGTNNGELQLVYSIGGTDYEVDLDLAIAASTEYDLVLAIDSARKPKAYVNGNLVFSGERALTTDIDLIPYVGVQADAAAAKALTVREIWLGKVTND